MKIDKDIREMNDVTLASVAHLIAWQIADDIENGRTKTAPYKHIVKRGEMVVDEIEFRKAERKKARTRA